MKETITLQLGSFGCFVGAHYWNIQNETLNASEDMGEETFDTERLFRTVGQGSNRRLLPRVLVTDLQENLGYMAFENQKESIAGYRLQGEERNEDTVGLWGGTVSRMAHADEPTLHPFQAYLQSTPSESYYASLSRLPAATTGARRIGTSASATHADMPVRPKENTIQRWSDFADTTISEASMYSMPLWCNRGNFDIFTSGCPNKEEGVHPAFLEGYLDQVRLLAEECDNLSTFQVFSDAYDGFAGFTSAIVEELHQDYRGVTMPVFAFTQRPANVSTSTSSAGFQLQDLAVPYMYSQLYENATATIPIHCPHGPKSFSKKILSDSRLNYHTSAVVAAAIESLTGASHLRRSPDISKASSDADMYDILFRASVGGRVPLCHMEACSPLSVYPDADYYDIIYKRIGPPGGSVKEDSSDGESSDCPVGTSGNLNPFMTSLSAARYSQWKVTPEQRTARYVRISNIVSIRGPSSENLPRELFSRSHPSQYLLTSCIQRQTALYLPKTYPHFFVGTDEFGFSEKHLSSPSSSATTQSMSAIPHGCVSMSSMASLGADTELGYHLTNIATTWEHSFVGTALRSQLDKSLLGEEERAEIAEKIHNMARCYNNE